VSFSQLQDLFFKTSVLLTIKCILLAMHIKQVNKVPCVVCLQKVTGSDMQYAALVGKPSEITFRYTEHVLTREAQKLGFKEPIKNMYLIGYVHLVHI